MKRYIVSSDGTRPLKTFDPPFSLIAYFLFFASIFFFGCNDGKDFTDDYEGNFNALWSIMDEHYCFFEYKNVDWNEVYERYHSRIGKSMTDEGFFELLAEMLCELKDGHVNLTSEYNRSRYSKWFDDYPLNYDDNIITLTYLGTDYYQHGGLSCKVLDDNIGYMRVESFSDVISNSNIEHALLHFAYCDGLIIDVRNNGGGSLGYAEILASHFLNEKIVSGYIQHKTGKGHSDFSSPYPIELEPATGLRWQKKVVILTNRHCYSATNNFVSIMRQLPLVTIIGDVTGGGGGLPMSSELPNGWLVRYSSSPILNEKKEQIEFGISPDIKVDMLETDVITHTDNILEMARIFVKKTQS